MKFWLAKDDDGDVYIYEKRPIKGSYSFDVADGSDSCELVYNGIVDIILGRALSNMEIVEVDAFECFRRPVSDSKSDLYPNGQLSSGKRKKHH